MNEQRWTQKLPISFTVIARSGFFVLVCGLFGTYALLLYQKEVSSRNILRNELQRLRKENYQLLERNQELERICSPDPERRSPSHDLSHTSIPPSELERTAQRSFVYTVQKGDTIWDIATMYNVDVNNLMRWNSLSPRSRIFPGDQLVIILEE